MKREMMAVLLSVSLLVPKVAATQTGAPLDFGGEISLASDYRFRGISQTLREMAIQAGIDLQGPSGLYGGVWGSNLNFGEVSPDGRAQAEIDVFGGIEYSVGDLVDLDLGLTYYGYPGTSRDYSYSFVELGLGASRDFGALSADVSAAYSPDYFGGSGTALYLGGGVGVPIGATPFSVSAALGRQTIDDNEAFGTPNYTDWSVGLFAGLSAFELGASYVGTDINEADCFGGSDLCKPRFVLSLSLGL